MAITLPGFPLLREGVYAGFNLTFACMLFFGNLSLQALTVLVLLSVSYFSYHLLNARETSNGTIH